MQYLRNATPRCSAETVVLCASPQKAYEMVMDSERYRSRSGEDATISQEVGGVLKARGDHIAGFNLALEPGRNWFEPGAPAIGGPSTIRLPHSSRVLSAGDGAARHANGCPRHRFDGHPRGRVQAIGSPCRIFSTKVASVPRRNRPTKPLDNGSITATSNSEPRRRVGSAKWNLPHLL